MTPRASYASRLLFLLVTLLSALLGGCGGSSSKSDGSSASNVSVLRLEVDPASGQVAKGTGTQFSATAILSNGTAQDVTPDVSWSSSNTAVAAMDGTTRGLAKGIAEGVVSITATYQGMSASGNLEVTSAVLSALQVTPATPIIAVDTTQSFMLTGSFSDGTTQDLTAQASWVSSRTEVASISNAEGSKGVARALSGGDTSIAATFSGQTATALLTVKDVEPTALTITPVAPTLAMGGEMQFVATATFSDGSTWDVTNTPYVQWSSSNTAVASISNVDGQGSQPADKGRAESLALGTTTISVTAPGLDFSDSTILTVAERALSSIEVSPRDASLGVGGVAAYTATAVFNDGSRVDITSDARTVWSSSDETVATVSNATDRHGRVQALKIGSTHITATHDGKTGSSLLTVTGARVKSIDVTSTVWFISTQATAKFSAQATYTDGSLRDVTDEVTWSSSNTATAQVSNAAGSKGLATGIAAGDVGISAMLDGVSDYSGLRVTDAVIRKIDMTPQGPVSAAKGSQGRFTAKATYSDGTVIDVSRAVAWSSSDTRVVTVSNAVGEEGTAQAVNKGQATIFATDEHSLVRGSVEITVTAAVITHIVTTPVSASVPAGFDQQYTATAHYSDGSTTDVTNLVGWETGNSAIATIDSRGLLTGVAPGDVTVTASASGLRSMATVTVQQVTLTSIDVSPKAATLKNNESLQYVAIGTLSDGSTRVITGKVTWATSDAGLVAISNADGSRGRATATGFPLFSTNVTVMASMRGVTGSTIVTRSF